MKQRDSRTQPLRRLQGSFIFSCLALLGSLVLIFAGRLPAQSGRSLPAAWTNWKYFRVIQLEPTQAEKLVSFEVPQEVYARSAHRLADLRVMDDSGAQVPYVLEVEYAQTKTVTLLTKQLENSFAPGEFTQIVLDAGERPPFHNGVRIETPLADFIAWTRVAISDDARHWRVTGSLAPIYRFAKRKIAGQHTIFYPETNARYLRVRIYDRQKQFPMNDAVLLHQLGVPGKRVAIDATFSALPRKGGAESLWQADAGAALPANEALVETPQPEFYRGVRVFASEDGQRWNLAGLGRIYRFPSTPPPDPRARGEAKAESRLSNEVDFRETWARYWRVAIQNGSDAPLENARPVLYMVPREVAFRQEPGRKYWLLYGQSETRAPRYDLAQTLTAAQIRAASPARNMGAEEINAAWTDPRPWSEKHSSVLWIAAIVSAILLAYVALRSLRQPA